MVARMRIIFTFILVLKLLSKFTSTEAFVFGDKDDSDENIGLLSDENCDCGSQQKHWFVYVMFEDKLTSEDRFKSLRICSGIIISPNVVMTSNRCLQLPGHTIQIYDAWQPVNIYMFSEIFVSYTPGPTPLTFKVTDILLSQEFALSSSLGEFPRHDVLLLLVETDLTKTVTPKLPICLAATPDKEAELRNPSLSTYEIIDNLQDMDDSNDRKCMEKHTKADTNLTIKFAALRIKKPISTIKNMNWCRELFLQKALKPPSSEKNVLCVESKDYELITGFQYQFNFSPLIITTLDGKEYLFGISTNLTVQLPTGSRLTYYTRIDEKLLKYIVAKMKRLDSKLCSETDNIIAPVGGTSLQSRVNWLWDGLEQGTDDPLPFPKPNNLNMFMNCECGAQNHRSEVPQVRIVGGEEAIPYEFGWIVYLLVNMEDQYGKCTASVVADNIVLTAAHCVANVETFEVVRAEDVAVIVNAHNRTGDENQVAKSVESIVVHPSYIDHLKRTDPQIYDIALLILKERFEFPNSAKFTDIHPVCLPKISDVVSLPVNATLVGYGRISFFREMVFPDRLKKGNVTVFSSQECQQKFNLDIPENLICSFNFPNNYVSALNGDSGGLVMYKNDMGNWVHLGVSSFIVHVNATTSVPEYCNVATGYMKTQRFMSFIEYVAGLTNARFCRNQL